eukprot:GILK01005834.1.p1 GENE.GILK01005834.1~~GILK01005834.1.p1  ORF type:complete len:1072 (+),score=257.64 GILK01005834.1:57-3218(+)
MATSSTKKAVMQHAHVSGMCDITYDMTGKLLFSVGSDTLVCKIDATTGTMVKSMETDDCLTTVAASPEGTGFAFGGASRDAILHNSDSMEFESKLVRCTLGVRHIAFHPKGCYVAVASDDGLKVVNYVSNQLHTISTDGCIRSVAWDPRSVYLAAAGSDGSLRLYDMNSWSLKKSLPILPKTDSTSYQLSRISWHPEGTMLAVPGYKEVKLLERDSWKILAELRDEHTKESSITVWSPNGNYLATAGLDQQLILWDSTTKQSVDRFKVDTILVGVSWNPTANAIAVIDVDGRYGIWEDPIASHMQPPHINTGAAATVKVPTAGLFTDEDFKMMEADMKKDETNADVDEDEVGTKRKRLRAKLEGEEDGVTVGPVVSNTLTNGKPEDPTNEKREFEEYKRWKEKEKERKWEQDRYKYYYGSNEDDGEEVRLKLSSYQPAFQPGSTPTAKRRFLVWNLTGTIVTHTEAVSSTIHIEFADTGSHKPIRTTDHHNFSMASLCEHGAIMACPSKAENPSVISYRPFNNWASKADWMFVLPTGEDAEAVALSSKWSAVATSKRNVRIFSYCGVQLDIFTLAGPVVAMAGFGRFLAVVYHSAPPCEGEQVLSYILYNIEPKVTVQCTGRVALSPASTLDWLGFAENGFLTTFDSRGMLRVLNHSSGQQWSPLLDTSVNRKSELDRHFIVGLTSDQLMSVIMKGGEETTYPATNPKPLLTATPFTMPLLQLDTTAGKLEEQYLKSSLLLGQFKFNVNQGVDETETDPEAKITKETAQLDKSLIQMIQNACKSDNLGRALDLASMLTLNKSLSIATQLANHNRLPALAQRIDQLLESRKAREQARLDQLGSDFRVPSLSPVHYQQPAQPLPTRPTASQRLSPEPPVRSATVAKKPAVEDSLSQALKERQKERERQKEARKQAAKRTREDVTETAQPVPKRREIETIEDDMEEETEQADQDESNHDESAAPEEAEEEEAEYNYTRTDVTMEDATDAKSKVQPADKKSAAAPIKINPFAKKIDVKSNSSIMDHLEKIKTTATQDQPAPKKKPAATMLGSLKNKK